MQMIVHRLPHEENGLLHRSVEGTAHLFARKVSRAYVHAARRGVQDARERSISRRHNDTSGDRFGCNLYPDPRDLRPKRQKPCDR